MSILRDMWNSAFGPKVAVGQLRARRSGLNPFEDYAGIEVVAVSGAWVQYRWFPGPRYAYGSLKAGAVRWLYPVVVEDKLNPKP